MAGPSNTDITTAIDLGAFPATYTQSVDDGTSPQSVWVKFTATQTGVVGLWGYGDFSTYTPQTHVYIGPTGAPSLWVTGTSGQAGIEVPVQFPVTDGVTYYINYTPSLSPASPATLHVQGQYFVNTAAPAGSIAVNDDQSGYPLAILSAVTGDNVQFIQPFPVGEAGDVLTSGRVLVEDIDADGGNGAAVLYDPTLQTVLATVISTTTDGFNRTLPIRATPDGTAFYVAYKGFSPRNASVVRVDADGTVGSTVWTLTGHYGLFGMAVSPDETILYFVESGNQAVQRWDLVNDTALSDLAAAIAGEHIEANNDAILVLADGRIVVPYRTTATGDCTIRLYNPDGTTDRTIALGTNAGLNRITSAIDPTHFWVWLQPGLLVVDEFRELNADTGATVTSVSNPEFEFGIYTGSAGLDNPRFGHSNSCPFWITRRGLPGPYTSQTDPIRRVRRFLLPFEQNYNLFISRLEILAQTGVGLTTGQGSDPVLMFRMSWDGGATWGNERQMSIGKIGQYLRRCYTMRLGSGRQPVAEIACSDPVFLSLLECYVDADKGLS